MKNPPDAPPLAPEDMVQDYLDFLCAPLAGVVPYEERQSLRRDAAYMIERLSNDAMVEGFPAAEATRRAILSYGASEEVSRQVVERWFRCRTGGWLARRIGAGNAVALIWFGQGTLWLALLLQLRLSLKEAGPIHFGGLSPAQTRALIPEPLPLPEFGPLLTAMCVAVFLFPFAAGAAVGWAVPIRPARSVVLTQLILTVYTFVFGMQMLPAMEGLLLAVAQLVWWLPVGSLTASVVALLLWRHRLRYDFGGARA